MHVGLPWLFNVLVVVIKCCWKKRACRETCIWPPALLMWSDCSTEKTDFFLNLLICVFASSPCSGLGFKGKVLSLSQGAHSTAPSEAPGCSSLLEIWICFFLVYGSAVLFCVFPIWFYLMLVDSLALLLDFCVYLLPMHPLWCCDHQFQSLARWNVLRTWRFLLDRICHYMTVTKNSQMILAYESPC